MAKIDLAKLKTNVERKPNNVYSLKGTDLLALIETVEAASPALDALDAYPLEIRGTPAQEIIENLRAALVPFMEDKTTS